MPDPCILQCLFETYGYLPYNLNTEYCYLISQQAIGPAQKLSSAQWLQHYAQGIYYLGKESNAETPRREFSCRVFSCPDSTPALDIRSHAVLSRLGVDSCIDILGLCARVAVGPNAWIGEGLTERVYQNLCQAKTSGFQNLLRSFHSTSGRRRRVCNSVMR